MDREPPPVTVTAPGSVRRPPDLLDGAPARPRRGRPAQALALLAVAVVVAGMVGGGGTSAPDADPVPPVRAAPTGITATASLAGAPTDEPYVQRLALTIDLAASAGGGDGGGRAPEDEVQLVGVRVRGFAVEADDPGTPVPLGRFGRSTEGRSTTVPVEAAVVDCSLEVQARRDLDLTVRTGEGPDAVVRAASDADVVRALDRLVSRTCRRPRG